MTCSNITIETLKQGVKGVFLRPGVFVVDFGHISHFVLVFLLFTLSS